MSLILFCLAIYFLGWWSLPLFFIWSIFLIIDDSRTRIETAFKVHD